MEQRATNQGVTGHEVAVATLSQEEVGARYADETPCPTCSSGSKSMPFVYAVGQITGPFFPAKGVEKEYAQAMRRTDTAGKTGSQAFSAVLCKRENRYLLRQLCWVLTVQGLETYLLRPRDPADHDVLVESIRSNPSPNDIDVVIGVRGPIAPPEMCNGLMIPVVGFDQIYSFDRDALINALPRPPKAQAAQFSAAAEELFTRIMQMTDNAGATDDHRAVNYLAMKYSAIYDKAAEQLARDYALEAVEVRLSALSTTRKIVDVIFSYTNRSSDYTEKFFVRVDVTEEFPFLVTKLSPYFDR
jgi:hypothetical protein